MNGSGPVGWVCAVAEADPRGAQLRMRVNRVLWLAVPRMRAFHPQCAHLRWGKLRVGSHLGQGKDLGVCVKNVAGFSQNLPVWRTKESHWVGPYPGQERGALFWDHGNDVLEMWSSFGVTRPRNVPWKRGPWGLFMLKMLGGTAGYLCDHLHPESTHVHGTIEVWSFAGHCCLGVHLLGVWQKEGEICLRVARLRRLVCLFWEWEEGFYGKCPRVGRPQVPSCLESKKFRAKAAPCLMAGACLSVCFSAWLSFCLSLCLSVGLSVGLSVCLHVSHSSTTDYCGVVQVNKLSQVQWATIFNMHTPQ